MRRSAGFLACALVAGCGTTAPANRVPVTASHEPGFVTRSYEPFNRQDVVAIALREWRLFGQPIEGETHLHGKAERMPGLWERIGEYWWLGQDQRTPQAEWTGKHDQNGRVFPSEDDAEYAWSAAFVSYVMRIGGAGDRFPYSPDHADYVNAAAAGRSPILHARAPQSYAPKPGDLICLGRGSARSLTFDDLPTDHGWPGHCAIVVRTGGAYLDAVGGNVSDAVELTHVPVTSAGLIAASDGTVMDTHHPWFVVLQVLYDAEAEPGDDG